MLSKLTCVLCYVALLRLRQGLSSALHLHLCRLSPFRYYPPRPYSKMFVGGLSWDTTDGTLSLLILPPTPLLQCHVHFTNSLSVRWWRVMLILFSFFLFFNQKACGTIFPSLAKSTPAPSFGTLTASRAVLLFSCLRIL